MGISLSLVGITRKNLIPAFQEGSLLYVACCCNRTQQVREILESGKADVNLGKVRRNFEKFIGNRSDSDG